MDKKVVIYTTSTCPHCAHLKEFLKEKDIPFENYDVSQNREKLLEMREKSHGLAVPVIDIDGKVMVGFNPQLVSKELGIK
ncbi:MAG: glutaredoxin family protein [Spirochaetes bacterium]|nr:glutaredoxin family protein [Spirochaetota bacterium]